MDVDEGDHEPRLDGDAEAAGWEQKCLRVVGLSKFSQPNLSQPKTCAPPADGAPLRHGLGLHQPST